MDEPTLRVISLGAGVQSSVMALMAARGEFDAMPDAAIFADTQWEPKAVYEHLDWLEQQLPFPVHRVTAGDLRGNLLKGVNKTGQPFIEVPVFVVSPDGKRSITRRQCTEQYKIRPIRKEVRRLLGVPYRYPVPRSKRVEQWIGISTDESLRMKESRDKWQVNRWPLIEIGMSRDDCRAWFAEHYGDRNLPRSACIGCPLHNDREFLDMRDNDNQSWKDAVFVDDWLRTKLKPEELHLSPGDKMYLWWKCKPLSEIREPEGEEPQMDLFNEECEGMCGV